MQFLMLRIKERINKGKLTTENTRMSDQGVIEVTIQIYLLHYINFYYSVVPYMRILYTSRERKNIFEQ